MKTFRSGSSGASFAPWRYLSFGLIVGGVLAMAACVNVNPPTDVGNPVAPSSSSSPAPQPAPTPTPAPTSGQPLAYIPDMKPVFDSDCVPCHSASFAAAGYAMDSYAAVMRAVQPGNANSALVVWGSPGGSMYRYWTGNRSQKANMVLQWVTTYNAQQSR